GTRATCRSTQTVGDREPSTRHPVGPRDPGGRRMSGQDANIAQWRAAVMRGRAITTDDADELEEHLREQLTDLQGAGLSGDEAFLVAVRRLGEIDAITAEFARAHS